MSWVKNSLAWGWGLGTNRAASRSGIVKPFPASARPGRFVHGVRFLWSLAFARGRGEAATFSHALPEAFPLLPGHVL